MAIPSYLSSASGIIHQCLLPGDPPLRLQRPQARLIFWLRRGHDYHIVFIDPKGIEHTDHERKIDGYRAVFEEDGKPRVLPHEGLRVRVHTVLYTENASLLSQGYENYWLDNIGSLLARLDS